MNVSNIIAIVLGGIGFIISIISLVVTPILNLKSKRLEKRLEYRFELFQKILELWEYTNSKTPPNDKTELIKIMTEVNKLIQLYGYNSEIKSFKELVGSYNYFIHNKSEINQQKLMTKFSEFFSISFNAYRQEIALEKLQD